MELFTGLDWISVTFPYAYPQRWRSCIHPADTNSKREIKPHNGYTHSTIYESGATESANDNRPDMGIHVVYSANAIAQMQQLYGVNQKQLLEHLCDSAKMTRMDVMLDCLDSGLDIKKLYHMALEGNVETQARSIGFQESATTGDTNGAETCYVGSLKKRKKLLRVYDKGAQTGELIDLKRFELELHRDSARDAAKRLQAVNLSDWSIHIAGLIRGYCFWPDDKTVAKIFADFAAMKIAVPSVPTGNTLKWLLDVCAPVLAREAIMDSSLIIEFMHRVNEELTAQGAVDTRGTGQ